MNVSDYRAGTPVGDPIEFESIWRVFGENRRTNPLHVASIKGNIGHLEGAAGIAALIKVCLMLQKKAIPPQANFSTLNPKIAALGSRGVEIPTSVIPWDSPFRVACVNNYGAAGSNAAIIVRDAPLPAPHLPGSTPFFKPARLPKYPVYISAGSLKSLAAYCVALKAQVEKALQISGENAIGDFAYNLANKQNRKLPYVLSTNVSGASQFLDMLSSIISGNNTSVTTVDVDRLKPVVLCFGGQVNDFVGLDKAVYEKSWILRRNLDECDAALRASGVSSLYPAIFQTEPIKDVVHLHGMFFSIQYASARAWMDSGLHIDAIIGHSFGQLTALCVSGSLSFSDGLKLVCGRASLMRTHWGPENGSMLSVEADINTVSKILSTVKDAGHEVEIACYNGPTSHVLVGKSSEIDAVQGLLASSPMKTKRLRVTHGFHSRLTEPLLPALTRLAEDMKFSTPTIPLETCSDGGNWTVPSPQLIAEHTRTAVFFGQAVQRLSSRLGPCVWLEAGSNSSIAGMVRRVLGNNTQAGDTFLPVSLSMGDGSGPLAETTVSLWKAGYAAQFWPFNRQQVAEYANINLPPYQFEKSRHWLEWRDTAETTPVNAATPPAVPKEPVLLTLIKNSDKQDEEAEFAIDPRSKEYEHYVKGHAVLAEPLCPAPLYIELVSRAVAILAPHSETPLYPALEDLQIKAPLGIALDKSIALTLKRSDNARTLSWNFQFTSNLRDSSLENTAPLYHATGMIKLCQNQKLLTDFAHYERLVSYRRFTELRDDLDTEAIQGSMIYKVFERVVTYAPYYKGVRAVFSKDHQVAGSVMLPEHNIEALKGTITKPLAVDNFFQVAGLHVNTLNDCGHGEVFVCTKLDSLRISPAFKETESKAWIVYSNFTPIGDREVINDIFVFDAKTKGMVLIGLGANFTRVSIASLTKILSKANKDILQSHKAEDSHGSPSIVPAIPVKKLKVSPTRKPRPKPKPAQLTDQPPLNGSHIATDVRKVLSKVAEVSESDIKDNSTLDDLGIDSLMIMEVLTEVQTFFKLEIPNEDWQTLTTPKLLANYLISRGCGGNAEDSLPDSGESSESMSRSDEDAGSGSDTTMTSTKSFEAEDEPQKIRTKTPPGAKPKPYFLQSPSSTLGSPKMAPLPFTEVKDAILGNAQQSFEDLRFNYDDYASQTGFSGFWKNVYPTQAKLVVAYTVEAFQKLGCDLSLLDVGEAVRPFKYLPKHGMLVEQLYNILQDASIITSDGVDMVRTEQSLDRTGSSVILEDLIRMFPQHADEHKLLHITGSKLAECLAGTDDAIKLLFRSKSNKELLERVYARGPMYEAVTKQLGDFLSSACTKPTQAGTIRILELGGGTGGTTKHVVDHLTKQGIPFIYTFSDISNSLVMAARNKFVGRQNMEFTVINAEKFPPPEHLGKYHIVLSTNCIHATTNLTKTTSNIRAMLRPDGFVSVVEFTRNLFWFDLVFGLLDGWWFFQDGRKHVLADQWFWDSSLRSAGFRHVTWTDGTSEESRTLRIITAFPAKAQNNLFKVRRLSRKRGSKVLMQTVTWKKSGDLELMADVYLPSFEKITPTKRPIGESSRALPQLLILGSNLR